MTDRQGEGESVKQVKGVVVVVVVVIRSTSTLRFLRTTRANGKLPLLLTLVFVFIAPPFPPSLPFLSFSIFRYTVLRLRHVSYLQNLHEYDRVRTENRSFRTNFELVKFFLVDSSSPSLKSNHRIFSNIFNIFFLHSPLFLVCFFKIPRRIGSKHIASAAVRRKPGKKRWRRRRKTERDFFFNISFTFASF